MSDGFSWQIYNRLGLVVYFAIFLRRFVLSVSVYFFGSACYLFESFQYIRRKCFPRSNIFRVLVPVRIFTSAKSPQCLYTISIHLAYDRIDGYRNFLNIRAHILATWNRVNIIKICIALNAWSSKIYYCCELWTPLEINIAWISAHITTKIIIIVWVFSYQLAVNRMLLFFKVIYL